MQSLKKLKIMDKNLKFKIDKEFRNRKKMCDSTYSK